MNNVGIGARLGAVFAALIVVVALVGGFGLARLASQKAAIDKVAGPRWEETEQGVTGLEQIGRETALVSGVFLSADVEAGEAAARGVEAADREADAMVDALYARVKELQCKPGIASMEQVVAARRGFADAFEKAHGLLKEGRLEEARALSRVEVLPRLDAVQKAWAAFLAHEGVHVRTAAGEVEDDFTSARTVTISLVLLAIVTASLIAIWITRSITLPVADAVAAAQRIAGGDLREAVRVTSGDEIGALQEAMRAMGEKLGEVIGEVRGGAEALTAASGQVSSTSQSLSQGTGEQAASV
ncbi:MAG: methyl-accepting chemotaxis protein, partial [Anaeromyxobacteraceae bacterium]